MPPEWPLHPAEAENRRHRERARQSARVRLTQAIDDEVRRGFLTVNEIRAAVTECLDAYG